MSTARPARTLSTAALVAAPLVMAAAVLVDVTPAADTTAELLGLVSGDPARWSAALLLFFLSGLLWVPAGLVLRRLFGPREPLGRIAAVAVLVGGAALVPLDAASLYLAELATSGLPLDRQVAVVDGVEGSAPLVVAEVLHVVGLFAGLLVLAVALLRSRNVSRWVPVLLLASLAGLVVAPGRLAEAAAMALLVAAFTGLAVRARGTGGEDTRRSAAVPVAS